MKKEQMKSVFQGSGLKSTKTRLAIVSVFSKECKPINAEYIFRTLKGKTNIVTIYRTLTSFEVAGIVNRVDLHSESVHYELAGHHHHHIVCTDCGRVESFEACNIKAFSKNIAGKSSYFTKIDQHSLELFGVCKICVKK